MLTLIKLNSFPLFAEFKNEKKTLSFFFRAVNMLRSLQKSYFHKNTFGRRGLVTVSKDIQQAYDVVIIGGGVAGVTLACALGKVSRLCLLCLLTQLKPLVLL